MFYNIKLSIIVLIIAIGIGYEAQMTMGASEVELGRARAKVLVMPTIRKTGRGRRIVSIKILQVRNLRYNNPFHQEQPVNNLNGTTYSSLTETMNALLSGSQSATNQTAVSSHCIGTYNMKQSPTAPPDHRFASIDVDPNTGQCIRVRNDSDGSYLIIQTPPDADPSHGVAFPDMLAGIWRIINPAPNDASGNGVLLYNNTPITITVKSMSGVKVQVTLKIIPKGGNEYDVQVIDIKRI